MKRAITWGQFGYESWVALLLIFGLAFVPRLAAIGRYITPDELIWVYRSVQFREALLHGQWAQTLTTGHPGVPTMWLGAAGITMQLWLQPSSHAIYGWITHLAYYNPDNIAAYGQFAHFLTAARLAVIAVNSLGIVAIYLLVLRVFGRLPAILATAFWAFDPFIVGLSGLLHVDALMTTFTTLSLLSFGWWAKEHGRFPMHRSLLFSALTAALAILSKSPALLLMPFVAFTFLIKSIAITNRKISIQFHANLRAGLVWLAVCLAVIFLCFPVLWVGPKTAVQLIASNANRHIETALRPTFFLGQMAYEHGLLYYPIALLFRLGPLALAGLALAVILWLRGRQRPSLPTLILILWPVLYLVAISVAEKKFDRYALPTLPALTILAATAWSQLRSQRPKILLASLLAIQLLYLVTALPYPLSTYNPLVGGSLVAQRVLTVGWGEAISAAGQWLSTQSGAQQQTAVASISPALAPYFSGQTLPSEQAAQADYTILTASNLQAEPEALIDAISKGRLLHTIHFNGLDQAWIVAQTDPQRPSPLADLPSPLSFDNRVQLLATDTTFAQEAVHVQMRWRLQQNGRYTLQLTLRDADNHIWSQIDAPLLNETDFYPEHWPSSETAAVHYTLPPPSAIPPGAYHVELSLFDANNAQLALLDADNIFRGVIYNLPDVTIPAPTNLAAVSDLDIGRVINQTWLDSSLVLWGHQPLPPSLLAGSSTTLDFIWQAVAPLPAHLQLRLQLGDVAIDLPLSRYPSGQWRTGQPIHEKYELPIAADMPAGQYELTVQPLTADSEPIDTAVSLGTIEIIATDRLFELPPSMTTALDVQFGSNIYLRGLAEITRNGDSLNLTLYWQSEQPPTDLYTVFVHVLDAAGNTITQADHWPGDKPTNSWAANEVVPDNYTISLPATPQPVQVAVGLYTAADGVRLPLTDAAGNSYPDNRLLLPLPQ